MDIDKRIADIMTKMKGLSAKNPKFPCGEFPPKWKEPISEEFVREFEAKNGIKLPEDYRRFITTVANGGTQPFYGMPAIDAPPRKNGQFGNVKAAFPFTLKKSLNVSELSEEEYYKLFENEVCYADRGFIELCHEGCGMFSILIVNTDDEETYGTVWYHDLCNDAGIFPLKDPKSGRAMRFLDWLEYYVDRTLELDNNKFFSYSELAVDHIG